MKIKENLDTSLNNEGCKTTSKNFFKKKQAVKGKTFTTKHDTIHNDSVPKEILRSIYSGRKSENAVETNSSNVLNSFNDTYKSTITSAADNTK